MNESLESFCCDCAGMLNGMSKEETQKHTADNSEQWSAQQLVEHLILTYRSSSGALEERLRKGRPTKAEVTPQQQVRRERLFVTEIFPEDTQAPERVRPGQIDLSALSGVELAELLQRELESMDSLVERCHEAFGQQPMASHWAFGPLSADEWRKFHLLHGRHHLKQLARIVDDVRASWTAC
ncbi:MAG TPA: DinB family protein [Pseudacidobacterium sp.]|jgi:hypothetical protein|nr:DinB family protein [Pseudacidobacterium sp.]